MTQPCHVLPDCSPLRLTLGFSCSENHYPDLSKGNWTKTSLQFLRLSLINSSHPISTPPQSISIIDLDSLLETVQWSRFWTLTIPVPPVHSNPTLTALWNYLRWLQSPVDSKDYEEFWSQVFHPPSPPPPSGYILLPNQSGSIGENLFISTVSLSLYSFFFFPVTCTCHSQPRKYPLFLLWLNPSRETIPPRIQLLHSIAFIFVFISSGQEMLFDITDPSFLKLQPLLVPAGR